MYKPSPLVVKSNNHSLYYLAFQLWALKWHHIYILHLSLHSPKINIHQTWPMCLHLQRCTCLSCVLSLPPSFLPRDYTKRWIITWLQANPIISVGLLSPWYQESRGKMRWNKIKNISHSTQYQLLILSPLRKLTLVEHNSLELSKSPTGLYLLTMHTRNILCHFYKYMTLDDMLLIYDTYADGLH